MQKLLFVCALILGLVACAYSSDVVELTAANFFDVVSEGTWFVEFYAPWCGHCKNLAPVWEQLATQLKDEGVKVGVAKYDASAEEAGVISSKFGIKGFPTLKVLDAPNKALHEYNGRDRGLESLAAFAKGGFSSSPGTFFSPKPDWYDPILVKLLSVAADGMDIVTNKIEMAILIFGYGFFSGVILASILFTRSRNSAIAEAQARAQAAAASKKKN